MYKRAHAASKSSGIDLAEALEQELKAALRKEGLSSRPSESGKCAVLVPESFPRTIALTVDHSTARSLSAELRALKRKKEKEKELDGIDMSNIIEETRGRRSRTVSKPYTYVDKGSSEEDEEEEEDEEDDEEDASGSDDGEGDGNGDASD